MELKRVLGFTTNSRNSFLSQPNSGNIIYVAGCVVVLFNPADGSQQHLISESKQTITCLAVSDDGHYLATADCANKVTIRIWNLRLARPQLEAAFVGHNYELSCMSFSCNNELLVSVGSQLDLTLNIWNWRRAARLASHKLATKVRSISFSADDSYFVTVGEAHVKYWYLKLLNESAVGDDEDADNSRSPATDQQPTSTIRSINEASSISISCRAATLGDQRAASFCDVRCGRGPPDSATVRATYCITKQGLLCELNANRLLHKWVDLRTASANCLAVGERLIVIGCANGVARCFSAAELRFMMNLPRPHLLGTDIAAKSGASKLATAAASSSSIYPSLVSVGLDEPSQTIACVYTDRSVYIWNLASPDIGGGGGGANNKVVDKNYSALYHSSCIWGIDVYPAAANQQLLPPGSFVTCSSDDTLRVWRPPSDAAWAQQSAPDTSRISSGGGGGGGGGACNQPDNKETVYSTSDLSDDCLKIVFTDPMHRFLCDLDCSADGSGGGGSGDADHRRNNYDSNVGLRCLKLSPNGRHLAAGSRSGAIRVFDFKQDTELKSIAAHDAEVLCLEYSDPSKFGGFYYLASSSRDKLIHLFDAANEYTFLQTIDDHSSSITALRFVNNRTDDCLQLISCGTDQKIVFRTGTIIEGPASGGPPAPSERLNFVTERLIEGKTTFFDMEVDSESSCLMTACQDRMIRLFNVAQVKYQSGFRGSAAAESSDGTIIKLALDPSCTFLAASCTDRTVSVYDYQRGESVATISEGLSDLVTDMKFSPDGSHLILCSGNGCIFIFSSPAEVANASRCLVAGNEAAAAVAKANFSPFGDAQSGLRSATNAVAAGLIGTDCAFGQQQQQQQQANGPATDYQVQQNSRMLNHIDNGADHEQNEDDADEDADHRHHQHDHRNQQRQQLLQQQNEFYLDEQAGQRYARSQRSASAATASIASGRGRLTRESAGGLVSNMAKYFQSRENLDKISSRQRYIHEGLFSGAPRETRADGGGGGRRRQLPSGGPSPSSLSGRFVGKDTVSSQQQPGKPLAGQPAADPTARAKSLSRLSTLQGGGGGGADCRRANSSGDEISSADDDGEQLVVANLRDFEMDRTSRSQQRLKQPQPKSARRAHQHPNQPMRDEADYASAIMSTSRHSNRATDQQWAELTTKSVPRRASSGNSTKHSQPAQYLTPLTNLDRRQQLEFVSAGGGGGGGSLYNSSATMRSSRSESNLRLARPSGAPMGAYADAAEDEYDLQRANEFDDDDDDDRHNQEGDVYELLAQRLHFSRLDANRVEVSRELCQQVVEELRLLSKFATRLHQRLHSAGAKDLAGLISRGVQSSLDVLSIVPPRAPAQPQLPVKSRSNLTAGRASPSHRAPIARLRPSAASAAAVAPRSQTGPRRSSVSASTATATAAAAAAAATSGSGGESAVSAPHWTGGGVKQSADYKAASQQQVQQQQQPLAPAGHAASGASKVSGETHQSAGQQQQQQPPPRLNIDQVLEAYSDRLFKMVQQRIEWSNGAATAAAANNNNSNNNNNNGTLGPDSKQQASER